MNILLLKVGTNDGSGNELPSLGMGIVARRLKELGHEIRVRDYHMCNSPLEWLKYSTALFLSCVSYDWIDVKWLIADYIANKQTVVVGGPHAYGYHDLITQEFPDITVVVGEADNITNEQLEQKGVVFLDHPTELLAPDYSDFYGADKMIGYTTYTSRGCTNVCSFCQSGKAHGHWRHRDLASLDAELDTIQNYPSVTTVHIVDDAFTGDIDHAKRFLELWFSKGYERIYKLNIFNVRADQLDKEILTMMKRAGIVNLPIGVESADPTVYKAVGKGESLDEIKEGIRLIQDCGIVPWLNMIVGLPFDTPERNRNSITWVKSIPGPKIVHWFQYSPFRGTKAYSHMVKQGAIEDGYIPAPYGRRYDELPWVPDFGTKDFTAEQRAISQMEAFLETRSPILINSMDTVTKMCVENGMTGLLSDWMKEATVKEYLDTQLPSKKERKQV